MPRARALGALLAVVLVALVATTTRADESSAGAPVAEAWYPSGLGTVAAPLQPAGTLHVGIAAGQETDRSYLRFELGSLPDDATVQRIGITIPLAADGGSQAPETAVLLGCAVPGGFEDGGGGDAPEVDCEGAPKAAFVEGTAPSFTLDVPVTSDGPVDLALVPGGGDTWHVGFDSREREGGSPASATVTYTVPRRTTTTRGAAAPASPTTSATDDVELVAPPVTAPSAPPADVGGGVAEQAEQTAQPQVVTTVATTGRGFAYPVVFALPLVLLVVLWLAGDGLTRPVRLRQEAS